MTKDEHNCKDLRNSCLLPKLRNEKYEYYTKVKLKKIASFLTERKDFWL